MRRVKLCMVLAAVTIASMYVYVRYAADSAAALPGGYVTAMFLIPSVFGLLTGWLAARWLNAHSEEHSGRYGWLILSGILFANIPSLYYILFMMFCMEGS